MRRFGSSMEIVIDFFLHILLLITRVGLRLIYGKNRRDELILSGHFGFHTTIQKWRHNHLWEHIWSKGKPKEWEPEVSELLNGLEGELFVDIGSSVGYYSLLLANNFKEIIAVEPEPETVNLLRKNTRHLDNIHIVEGAISDEDGEATFYISPTLGWHTITPTNKKQYTATKTKVQTLKTLLDGRKATLVKVDTEGAELKILDGAPQGKVEAWLIEAHGGESRMKEIDSKLSEMGYETSWISENHIYAH